MNTALMIAIDLVAISAMTFGLYFRRHRRRDLVVAFLVVNVGVLAVSLMLASSEVAVGLGLGLFGVLSIIRLRSSEISQSEVAYYFASLALGLIAGLATLDWIPVALMALIVAVIFVGDNPALLARYRHQTMTLDTAFTDESALRAHLESLLGACVRSVTVQHVDLVNDTTLVDVRYQLRPASGREVTDAAADPTSGARHESLTAGAGR